MNKYVFASLLVILFAVSVRVNAGASSVESSSKSVTAGGITRTVTMVTVDLSDSSISVECVPAQNKIGLTDDLSKIAELCNKDGTKPLAAINGTFFNSYSDMLPQGAVKQNGEYLHTGAVATIGFTSENRVLFENLKLNIVGELNGSRIWPNNWSAWAINRPYTQDGASFIYTPAYMNAATPEHNGTSVIVRNNIVTEIKKGAASIPQDGFVLIYIGGVYDGKFKVGDSVRYAFEYADSNGNIIPEWSQVLSSVSVGPTLLRGGKVSLDFSAEGFTDPKITDNSAQRSFIGINASGKLVMGTVPNVTVRQLADVAASLGLADAINLDGGASSSLWYKDNYLTLPGRKISNAIVVTQRTSGTKNLSLETSSWAKAEVLKSISMKIVPGDLQKNYQSDITRAEFCRLIAYTIDNKRGETIEQRISYGWTEIIDITFSDTTDPAVMACAKLGIVNGSNGQFKPNDTITRQEAAAMLARTAQFMELKQDSSDSVFADSADIAAWAVDSVNAVNKLGLMRGTDKGFEPLKNITREQAIITFVRLREALD